MAQLRVPGPTPCPPEVLKAMAWQMVNHRGPEFHEMLTEVTENLKKVFQTKNDVLLLTGSGTGGLEAAIVNTLSHGDKVLSVAIGVFGDRFANIAKTFGADVVSLKVEWGKAADPDAIKKALKDNPGVKAVMVTHNETSTGVTNDIAAIAKVVKDTGKLLIVDAISSLGSINLPVDKLGCDVVITASQKGWMVPPGMAMVSVSPEAWKAREAAKVPNFYWDFVRAKKIYEEKRENPWTPAIPIVFAFTVALKMMLKEGINNIFARHERIGQMTREGIKKLGLSIFAEESHASNTVTAVSIPEGLDGKKFRQILREQYKVVLAGGQQTLDGKIFRIGHLGMVDEKDIKEILSAIQKVLPLAGFKK
ncbi:MAG: alanine--glyoxylate aminotransferase family protein [Sedimentisphaerales bacterium]|nr:alanine--glyoxylate aminotransferase family protein [Sedimentisphaerales bacterium]